MQVTVERADDDPLRFRLGQTTHEVLDVLDRWFSPTITWYKVRADDGHLYILRCENEQWTLASFTAGEGPSLQ